MKYILKYCIRNICENKLRTSIIVICISAVTFVMSVCMLISFSANGIIENQMRKTTGNADISITFKNDNHSFVPPENTDVLYINMSSVDMGFHNIENYNYAECKSVRILGLETNSACEFGLLEKTADIMNNEAIISSAVSSVFGYEKGDIINVPCSDGTEASLTVKDIILCEKMLSIMPMSVIVTPETAEIISGRGYNIANIDVIDNKKTTEIYNLLKQKYPENEIQQLMGSSEISEIIKGTAIVFYLILIIVLLMTFFILRGFSKNIIAERMSVIGTFRSIGTPKSKAAGILLLENGIYGVSGGIIGLLLFFVLCDTVIGSFLSFSVQSAKCSIPFFAPLSAFATAFIIPVLCSASAVISTAKTPVRDLIFGKKDTAYTPSFVIAFAGLSMLILSAFLSVSDMVVFKILSLVLSVTGLCLFLPFLLFLFSKVASHFSGKTFPILRLSLIGLGTKKLLVSATIMLSAAFLLTSAVLVLTDSVKKIYSAEIYNCDIIISGLSERTEKYYDVIRNNDITDYEFIFSKEENIDIDGNTISANIISDGNFSMLGGIENDEKKPSQNEIILDKTIMKKLGIKAGDSICVIFRNDTIRPVNAELTALDGCDSVYFDQRCNTVIINPELYKSIYKDYPSMLLLNTENDSIYLADKSAEIKTYEEYCSDIKAEENSVMDIMGAVIVLGITLSVISSWGNLSVSLLQRKHEFAVLYSSGMSRKILVKLIITEMLCSALVSAFISAVFCPYITKITADILSFYDFTIPIKSDFILLGAFTLGLTAVILTAAFIQSRTVRKMNIAEQLKYE